VIGNFLRGQEREGSPSLRNHPRKEVVWKFADYDLVKLATNVKVLKE